MRRSCLCVLKSALDQASEQNKKIPEAETRSEACNLAIYSYHVRFTQNGALGYTCLGEVEPRLAGLAWLHKVGDAKMG